MCNFVIDVSTKEVLALLKEEESKLFHVALKDDEKKNTIERVFSDVD